MKKKSIIYLKYALTEQKINLIPTEINIYLHESTLMHEDTFNLKIKDNDKGVFVEKIFSSIVVVFFQ